MPRNSMTSNATNCDGVSLLVNVFLSLSRPSNSNIFIWLRIYIPPPSPLRLFPFCQLWEVIWLVATMNRRMTHYIIGYTSIEEFEETLSVSPYPSPPITSFQNKTSQFGEGLYTPYFRVNTFTGFLRTRVCVSSFGPYRRLCIRIVFGVTFVVCHRASSNSVSRKGIALLSILRRHPYF